MIEDVRGLTGINGLLSWESADCNPPNLAGLMAARNDLHGLAQSTYIALSRQISRVIVTQRFINASKM